MGWMPGLVYKPGDNAGNLGNRKQNCRLHYTVGRDSTGIGLNGYFHFLVPKEGTPIQFAPTEAVCWDACEWNPSGYGVEIERLSDAEPLTDSQIAWVGRIARWANESDGIPLTFRDSPGDRVEPSAGFRGFITHRSLAEHKCDQHYDYISQDDWNRAISAAPQPDLAAIARRLAELSEECPMFDGDVTKDGTLFVPGIGNDQHIYCYRIAPDGTVALDQLGGGGYSNPVARAQGSAVSVIVQGGNSKKEPFVNRWDGSKWSGWKSLGGQIKNVVGTV